MSGGAPGSAEQDDGAPLVPAYVERRENCPRYVFSGGVWIVLADSARTAGHIANLESIYERGRGLPRRVHHREAEMAYVISGRLRVCIGDEPETTAEPGAMVFIPAGVTRTLTADADGTRVYHGFVPAGVERMIVEHGTTTEEMIVQSEGAPIDAVIAASYGVSLS